MKLLNKIWRLNNISLFHMLVCNTYFEPRPVKPVSREFLHYRQQFVVVCRSLNITEENDKSLHPDGLLSILWWTGPPWIRGKTHTRFAVSGSESGQNTAQSVCMVWIVQTTTTPYPAIGITFSWTGSQTIFDGCLSLIHSSTFDLF